MQHDTVWNGKIGESLVESPNLTMLDCDLGQESLAVTGLKRISQSFYHHSFMCKPSKLAKNSACCVEIVQPFTSAGSTCNRLKFDV